MPHIKCNLCLDSWRGLFCVFIIFWFSFSRFWRVYRKNVISNVIRIVDHAPADLANGQLANWPNGQITQVWGKCSWCNANKIKGNCKCKWNTKLPSHLGHLEEFYRFINNEKIQKTKKETRINKIQTILFRKCVNWPNESHLNWVN